MNKNSFQYLAKDSSSDDDGFIVKNYKKKEQNNTYTNKFNTIGKRILCNNIINTGVCSYNNKCKFAHTLQEQNVDGERKIVYDILQNKSCLKHINLQKDIKLYRQFLNLTHICNKCVLNKCSGGYNCKIGVCMRKLCICVSDLNYGNCSNTECRNIHLTKRGLNYYYKNNANANANAKTINKTDNADLIQILSSEKYFNNLKSDILLENNSDTSDIEIYNEDITDENTVINIKNIEHDFNESIFS